MAEETNATKKNITENDIRNSFDSLNSILAAYSKNLSDIDDAEAKRASAKLSAIGKDFIEGEVNRSVHSVIDTFTSMVDKVSSKDYSPSDTKKKMYSLLFLPSSVGAISNVVDELVKEADELSSHLESTGIMKVEKYRNTLDGSVVTKEDYGKMSEEDRGKYVAVTGYDDSSISSIDSAVNYITSITKSVSKVEKISRRDIRRNSNTVKSLSKTVPAMIDGLMSAVVSINSTIGSDERVKQLIGWQTTSELEYLTWTDKNGNEHFIEKKDKWGNPEKIENLRYVKPHFAAENGLFRVGEYLTKVFSSIDKLSSMDSSKLPKPRKLRRNMKHLAGEVQDTVQIITREFSKINVDRNRTKRAMSLLLGDQGTETTIERSGSTLLTSQSVNGYNKESNDSSVTKMVAGKRVSVFEMINGFFDAANKIMSFDFKDFFKKSRKFKRKARRVSASVASIVESVLKMVDVSAEHSKEEFDAAISNIKKLDAVSDSMGHLIKIARKIVNNAKSAKFDDKTEENVERLVGVLLIPINKLGNKEASANAKNAVKTTALFVVTIGAVIGIALLVATTLGKNAGQIGTGTLAMAGFTAGSTSILEKLSEKQDEIKEGALILLYIGGAFLLFTASILLLGLAKGPAASSIAAFGVLVIASLVILWAVQKITDRGIDKGSGLPNACLPLLAIAGSFILFSLSILLLGLTNEITLESLLAFAAIVGIAVGILFLLSRLKNDVLKGSFSMLVMGAAFLVFSGVLAIMAVVSEDMDFEAMLALTGIMAALIGIGVLAGLASIPILAGGIAMLVLSVGLLAMSLSLWAVNVIASRMGDPRKNIKPLFDAISYVVNKMSDLSLGAVLLATANASLVMIMMTEILVTCLLFDAIQSVAPKKEDSYKTNESLDAMVDAIGEVADRLSEISIRSISRALLISLESVFMLLNLSLVSIILTSIGNRRVPTSWDSKGKPNAWAPIDPSLIAKSKDIATTLVNAVGGIAEVINGYDINELRKAKRRVRNLRKITNCVGSMLNLVVKLTEGPISYGEVDEDGNLVKGTYGTIKGSLGDYIKSHSKQIKSNIMSLIGIFTDIAKDITGEDGIGNLDSGVLRKGKRNIRIVEKIIGLLDPAIELIKNLSSGEYTIKGEVDENGKRLSPDERVNLGEYLNRNSSSVKKNVSAVITMLSGIAKTVTNEFKEVEQKDLRKSKRKIAKVSQIVESLNPAIELIKSLSTGEYTIPGEDGAPDEKVNLGKYLDAKAPIVEGNIETLIKFVGKIGEKAAILGKDDNTRKKDLKKGEKKATLVNSVLDTITGTLELIQQLASGEIQVGTNEDGSPIMENMSKFLTDNAPSINDNIDLLIDFVIGPNGIQSHISKLTGEKDKTTDLKKNALSLLEGMTDAIDQIINVTMKIGTSITDSKTADLFSTDESKNLRGQLARLIDGYSVPLGDSTIFANAVKFKTRLKNLTDYDKLMKKIIDIKNVSNYEKSVKATGDMVKSINSIDDLKIDKLNTLMKNMIKFGETMDTALKNVLDQVVDLSKELHYIIEYNENNPRQAQTGTAEGSTSSSSSTTATGATSNPNEKQEPIKKPAFTQFMASKLVSGVASIDDKLNALQESIDNILASQQ